MSTFHSTFHVATIIIWYIALPSASCKSLHVKFMTINFLFTKSSSLFFMLGRSHKQLVYLARFSPRVAMRIARMFWLFGFTLTKRWRVLEEGLKEIWLNLDLFADCQQIPLVKLQVIFFKFLEVLIF